MVVEKNLRLQRKYAEDMLKSLKEMKAAYGKSLAALDNNVIREGLPFMVLSFEFCGKVIDAYVKQFEDMKSYLKK